MKPDYNGYQDKRIDSIEKSITVLNHNSTKSAQEMAEMKTDVGWIKKMLSACNLYELASSVKRHDKILYFLVTTAITTLVGLAILLFELYIAK